MAKKRKKEVKLPKVRSSTIKEKARKLRVKPDVNKIISQIRREGVYQVTPSFTTLDGNVVRKDYYTLIEKKTLKDDKSLMNDIIKHRGKILQHRISCNIDLFSNGKVVASLKAFKILIEHRIEIMSFWIGLTIDPSSFKVHNETFQAKVRHLGVSPVHITVFPTKKEKIDAVGTTFMFS